MFKCITMQLKKHVKNILWFIQGATSRTTLCICVGGSEKLLVMVPFGRDKLGYDQSFKAEIRVCFAVIKVVNFLRVVLVVQFRINITWFYHVFDMFVKNVITWWFAGWWLVSLTQLILESFQMAFYLHLAWDSSDAPPSVGWNHLSRTIFGHHVIW